MIILISCAEARGSWLNANPTLATPTASSCSTSPDRCRARIARGRPGTMLPLPPRGRETMGIGDDPALRSILRSVPCARDREKKKEKRKNTKLKKSRGDRDATAAAAGEGNGFPVRGRPCKRDREKYLKKEKRKKEKKVNKREKNIQKTKIKG